MGDLGFRAYAPPRKAHKPGTVMGSRGPLTGEGARLIALGMSRYWHANDGPRLDVGPIAAA